MEAGTKVKTPGGNSATVIGSSAYHSGSIVIELEDGTVYRYKTARLRKYQQPRSVYRIENPDGQLRYGEYDGYPDAREACLQLIQHYGNPDYRAVEFKEVLPE